MNNVVELRQYTLKPGMRESLISLFDREFLESQEACGCDVIGQFRDLDVADRFVWLRGFADMTTRGQALAAFYDGPVWKAHREAANATMLDSDNVLLLRPARPYAGFDLNAQRPPLGQAAQGVLTATICRFKQKIEEPTIAEVERNILPKLEDSGDAVLAWFATEYASNNFPRLPVREAENVVVWFARRMAAAPPLPAEFLSSLLEYPLTLRLSPTPRSKLRVSR
ncbi:MAG: NIPSNAP family protein [Alphaproteobacteria bacterium]|nr:NIPSNAP family protein [Alphaproteobacteria bacterium]